ncbi:MAG: hypothetical protein AAF221_03860 [Pseudomonadota bacterium]
MASITLDQLQRRLLETERRREIYEQRLAEGKLTRGDSWRLDYLKYPYLLGAPDFRLKERFRDVFLNVMELGEDGRIRLVSLTENDAFMQMFSHILEEYQNRTGGEPPGEDIEAARSQILGYHKNGKPIGVKLFQGYEPPNTPILVKYGKREFLEPMISSGRMRIANAGMYSKPDLIGSMHDNETSREFFIPTFKERLNGQDHLAYNGDKIEFHDDDIRMPVVFGDYYVFSLCEDIHIRMPTDFDADAAIVVRDPIQFKQRLISTFLAHFPDWKPIEGNVTYYDPYRDYTKIKVPEMVKHFRYAYQKEVRIVFKPLTFQNQPLEPVFLSIGSMSDYSDLVSLN